MSRDRGGWEAAGSRKRAKFTADAAPRCAPVQKRQVYLPRSTRGQVSNRSAGQGKTRVRCKMGARTCSILRQVGAFWADCSDQNCPILRFGHLWIRSSLAQSHSAELFRTTLTIGSGLKHPGTPVASSCPALVYLRRLLGK